MDDDAERGGGGHMSRVLLLLGLLAPLGALAVSRFHERNHTGLLFLYAFDEGQVPTSPPTQVRDVSGRNLMGNLTTSTTGAVSWSADRQGVSVPSIGGGARATSQLTSSSLFPLLSTEFSIELFLSNPENPLSQNLLIAGFGDWPPGAPFAPCDATNTVSEGGWRVSSDHVGVIDVDVVLLSGGVPRCVSASLAISRDELRHFVVRVRSGVLSVVSHGGFATIAGPNPMFSPSLWARHPAPLTIASPHATTGWTGTVYMVAMYDRYLSDEEIAANRVLGPPNSVPYGAGAVEVDEDVSVALVSP
jgi:hypothetical protein